MKYIITFLLLTLSASFVFAQIITSGNDDINELHIAYDSNKNIVSGYYESTTGWDEAIKTSRFSCIFYITGKASGPKFNIDTYFPLSKSEDLIRGTLQIIDSKTIKITLPKDHGGCWNVEHFADSGQPAIFHIESKKNWFQIRYVIADKAYFYKEKTDISKMKSYTVKGDFVCIDSIKNNWAHCIYIGEKITTGWMKLADLNNL